MIEKEIINGKVFLRQTTFYVYDSEEDQKNSSPNLVTSDYNIWNYYKKRFQKIKK